ncbi:signal peptidase I [Aquibacillus koreensis]|uniref:Signal peptidase I n=1 Tax=Aquibacillus koreensis TaxID=279446 RepID=A0A9X4AL59_9BACI|nr:signal peptidase I [Aquibacillus koreensis]MCT2536199.1 signal peptidase I [Aquibacillus koreensis]MDC3422123.1 signal peptidase I [Aquibacillus koreensis]
MNSPLLKEVLSWIKAIAIALIIVLVCRQFILTPSIVKGESMMPNLHDGDRIILVKFSSIDRFDEIAFHAPDSEENYVKRVIGLPGDTIEMKDDALYINGEKQNEPYLDSYKSQLAEDEHFTDDFTLESLTNEQVVPEGYYFVMGDNRIISKDSREFGFISEDEVIGDVKMRIWPLQHFGVPD